MGNPIKDGTGELLRQAEDALRRLAYPRGDSEARAIAERLARLQTFIEGHSAGLLWRCSDAMVQAGVEVIEGVTDIEAAELVREILRAAFRAAVVEELAHRTPAPPL